MKKFLRLAKGIYFAFDNKRKFPKGIYDFSLITLYFIYFWLKELILHKIFYIDFKQERFLHFTICFDSYSQFLSLFEDIFLKHTYHVDLKNRKPFILDCGAHIGMSVIYFKWLYPSSTILAFEPGDITFQLLKKNIQINNIKDVKIIKRAVSDNKAKVKLYCDKYDPTSTIMSLLSDRYHSSYQKVQSEKLSTYITSSVDILKLDIEGSEVDVINDLAQSKKLELVNNIVMEFHYHKKRGKKELAVVLRVLKNNHFKYIYNPIRFIDAGSIYQDIHINAYREDLLKSK